MGLGPSICARNHNRLWANDNGTRSGRTHRTNPTRAAPAPAIRAANPAGVDASNNTRTPTSTPNTTLNRDTNRIANNECPPNS
ncbi:hypothetical protein, partial [Streptomyces sp. SID5789]|uniref:hypothetical protein n=1 Tax=Streptomyces sp. SID5789 TaxID=2690310 RepID=UPI001F2D4332